MVYTYNCAYKAPDLNRWSPPWCTETKNKHSIFIIKALSPRQEEKRCRKNTYSIPKPNNHCTYCKLLVCGYISCKFRRFPKGISIHTVNSESIDST